MHETNSVHRVMPVCRVISNEIECKANIQPHVKRVKHETNPQPCVKSPKHEVNSQFCIKISKKRA